MHMQNTYTLYGICMYVYTVSGVGTMKSVLSMVGKTKFTLIYISNITKVQ